MSQNLKRLQGLGRKSVAGTVRGASQNPGGCGNLQRQRERRCACYRKQSCSASSHVRRGLCGESLIQPLHPLQKAPQHESTMGFICPESGSWSVHVNAKAADEARYLSINAAWLTVAPPHRERWQDVTPGELHPERQVKPGEASKHKAEEGA